MRTIALFGGTFDPVHNGHLNIIRHLKGKFGRVAVIPGGIPPHKKGTAKQDRLNMLRLAAADADINTLEIDSPEVSYTYKTLEKFSDAYDKIYFCIGSDSLFTLPSWKNPEIIAKLAALYVIPRPGKLAGLEQFAQYIRVMYNAEVIISDFTGDDISSTLIRINLAFDDYSGLDAKVADYIKEHALYRDYRKFTDNFEKYGLSKRRIEHTLRVAREAVKLASQYHTDKEKAAVAALLHDVAKNITLDEAQKKGYISSEEYSKISAYPQSIHHSFIGAKVAVHDFGIADTEILDAIMYHTTGRPDMSQLEKIILIADYIEEGRDFENLAQIREATYSDLDKGLVAAFKNTLEYLKAEGKEICSLTVDAYDYYGVSD